MIARFLAGSIFVALGIAACANPDADATDLDQRVVPTELRCKADSDCEDGEACTKGACLPKRCGAAATQPAPAMGQRGFLTLREGLVVATDSDMSGFGYSDGQLALTDLAATGAALDIAGGHFHDDRPESVATLRGGSSLEFAGAHTKTVSLSISAVAVTAGDVDGDGLDEAIAASVNGDVAVCKYSSGACTSFNVGVSNVVDVAAADLDGDGALELLLLDASSRITVATLAADGKSATNVTTHTSTGTTTATLTRIAAGDADGDGKAEIVGVAAGGFFDSAKAFGVTLDESGYTLASTAALTSNPVDVTFGTLEGTGSQAIVLTDDGKASVFGDRGGTLSTPAVLTVSGGGKRIAASDFQGKSTTARSLGDAKVVEGSLEPIAVLFPPPYSKTYSSAPPFASIGADKSNGTSKSDSVSNSYGAFFGLDVSVEGIGASVEFTRGWGSSLSKRLGQTVTVGDTFSITAKPELDGYESGGVMLSCTCYQKYDYQIEDPSQQLGADGKKLSIYLPIGPKTQVLSLRRYAALAQALPDELPTIKPAFKLGDPSSYPKTPTALDGKKIAANDLVFKDAQSLRISDAVDVGFSLNMSEQQGQSTSVRSSSSVSGTASAFFVYAGIRRDSGDEHTEEISLGQSTTFSGRVPAMRDDPNTPEDEFKDHAYSFTPVVYLQHYAAKNGKKSGYYVLTYTVGD